MTHMILILDGSRNLTEFWFTKTEIEIILNLESEIGFNRILNSEIGEMKWIEAEYKVQSRILLKFQSYNSSFREFFESILI